MAIAYGIMLFVSIGLLVGYCLLIKQKEPWLITLYVTICVVNLGYLLLAVSKTVDFALIANKIAYLGHIFLLISMFFNIIRICGFRYKKWLPITLISIGVLVLGIICTTGYLPWYYEEVSIEVVDGATKLVKTYGPLHTAYLVYVLAYFVAMIVAIILSIKKRMLASHKQAGLLAAVVLCNIAMWIVEKFVTWNFEFLSVSYILSGCMLLFLYWLMQDYVHKKEVEDKQTVVVVDSATRAETVQNVLSKLPDDVVLTSRQIEMLEGIVNGKTRKEIADSLHLSENTVKTHIATLYKTLGVTSKEEIYVKFK